MSANPDLHAAGNRAAAIIVDELRAKLPPQYVDLRTIRTLLAFDATTAPAECELLAALMYLELRGEVKRDGRYGWRKAEQRKAIPPELAQFCGIAPAQQPLALPEMSRG